MVTFCIRDDDTNYFTTPEALENAYKNIWEKGPVSLSVVPFHKGCQSRGIPAEYRTTGEIYPFENNRDLVLYLRQLLNENKIEIMLHGYHHEDFFGWPEFVAGNNLEKKVCEGKKYLEKLLNTKVRVFVPPHNSISREGLRAVISSGLHLGCLAGMRAAWPVTSWLSWRNWWRIKQWSIKAQLAYPWVVRCSGHNEVYAHAVTPTSDLGHLRNELNQAASVGGVVCLATHFWEFDVKHTLQTGHSVREQIQSLIEDVQLLTPVQWITMGDLLSSGRRNR